MYASLLNILIGLCLLLICLAVILLLIMIWRLARHRQLPSRRQIGLVLLGVPAVAVLIGFLPGLNWLMDLALTDSLFGHAMILPAPAQEARESFKDLNGNFSLYRIYRLSNAQFKEIESAIASHPGFPTAEKADWTRHSWVKLAKPDDMPQIQSLVSLAQNSLGTRLPLEADMLASLKAGQAVYLAGYAKGNSDLELYLLFPQKGTMVQIALDN